MKFSLWKDDSSVGEKELAKEEKKKSKKERKQKKREKSFIRKYIREHPLCAIAFTVMLSILLFTYLQYRRANIIYDVSYLTFTRQLEEDMVRKVVIDRNKSEMIISTKDGLKQRTELPDKENFKTELLERGIWVKEKRPLINDTTFNVVLLVGALSFLAFSIRRRYKDIVAIETEPTIPDITLDDVAGNEKEKKELQAIIRFIKEPETFKRLGVKIPKGILLIGPPGTGKTLFARAVAGEAQLPLYETSGSDFVKMYTGAGASRVRELFEEARSNSPCVLFIDEIDAVGGKRSQGESAEERNNTLNALLVEMSKDDNIIIIAATNRQEMLDEALLRAGRLSKHITLNVPTKKDRMKIIEKHLFGKQVAKDVTTEYISSLTVGQSGAYIENLLNEAVIQSVLNERVIVTRQDINTANLQIMLKGYTNSDIAVNEETKRIVAYHEAGHTLATKLLTNDEVTEVSIIPTTSNVGGYTVSNANEDVHMYKKKDLVNKITILCAGRAAEYLLGNKDENEITTGASNDIEQATRLLHNAITVYGLGDSGAINLRVFETDSALIADEMVQTMKDIFEDTVKLLEDNRVMLDLIAGALIENESISGAELDNILNGIEVIQEGE